MAFSKAKLFDPLSFQQSFWSKALSHPARIIILNYLLENGTTPFREFKKIIPLAPTTISQHLRTLREKELIEAEEKFPHTYYNLNRKNCKDLAIRITDLHLEYSNLPIYSNR
jgi:ArsR family transcriptional regulator